MANRQFTTFMVSLLLLTACGDSGTPAPSSARLDLPDERVEITVKQRTATRIPGSDGKLFLHVGDITGGRVDTSLTAPPGVNPLDPTPMSPNDEVQFDFGSGAYRLTLLELSNALVGDDFATFEIAAAGATRKPEQLTERQKIERLLAAVAELENAVFVRNGVEYSGADAVAHMRRKLDVAGNRIKTAEQFIEHLATKSSQSGEPYLIRYNDGREMSSAQFLNDELQRLNTAQAK